MGLQVTPQHLVGHWYPDESCWALTSIPDSGPPWSSWPLSLQGDRQVWGKGV